MKPIQKCLGENVKRLRLERGLTQGEFSKQSKLSLSFLQNVESGKKWIGPESIEVIARTLKVRESELFRDCDLLEEPDPKAMLKLMCKVFGVLLNEETVMNAVVRKPFHYYSSLYSSFPDDLCEEFMGLSSHPNWKWEDFRKALLRMKKEM